MRPGSIGEGSGAWREA